MVRSVLTSASAAFVLAVTYLHAQIPAGPLMWFRADSGVVRSGDTVTRWRDISGNGYDAVPASDATRPLFRSNELNGRDAVWFQGAHYLRCPDRFPVGSDYTKVVVVRIDNFGAVNNILSGAQTHAFWLGGTAYPKMFHSGTFVDSYVRLATDATILHGAYDSRTATGTIFVDGTFAAAGYTATTNADSALQIGAFAGGYGMNGVISEIVIYNRRLTDSERTGLEQYLGAKYHIRLMSPQSAFPFTSFPKPFAFYTRDESDSATVPIAGTLREPGFDSVRVDMYRDGGYWKSTSQPLVYGTSGAPFALAPRIYARPVEFGFKVYLVGEHGDSLIGERDSIACGDALLITGQSNSTPGNPGVTYSNEFCRTFGVNTGLGNGHPSDTVWGRSDASNGAYQGRWHVGVWGLRMQQLLLERLGIPTCVITGGVGGTSIQQNQRDDSSPENLSTIYGRTLYRARASGMRDRFRALFWYQGESNSVTGYYDRFLALYSDWRRDYPTVDHFYIIQIRPGCSADPATMGALRELQRTLADSLPMITTHAPTGVPGHDGCHYTAEGYYALATQLYRLIARDLYGSDDSVDIASPNIERAYYSTAARDQITLCFQPGQHMTWPDDTLVADTVRRAVDQFFLDGSAGNIAAGHAEGNTIVLTLRSPSTARSITFVPSLYYEGTTTVYEGPWIVNRRGVGAFTFANVPIELSATGETPAVSGGNARSLMAGIAPNPSSGRAVIEVTLEQRDDVSLVLYDAAGHASLSRRLGLLDAGTHRVEIDPGRQPSGVYRCVVRTGVAATSFAVIITH